MSATDKSQCRSDDSSPQFASGKCKASHEEQREQLADPCVPLSQIAPIFTSAVRTNATLSHFAVQRSPAFGRHAEQRSDEGPLFDCRVGTSLCLDAICHLKSS